MSDAGSSVPRRTIGRLLKQAREEARVPVEAVAATLEVSRQKIYRIENGEAPVRAVDAKTMCELYGVDEGRTEALIGLAKETKAKGWWHAYNEVITAWFDLYLGMEAAASSLRQYAPALIPGLLQTPEYAAAIFNLSADATPADTEQRVQLRMGRQRLFTRPAPKPPAVEVILEESVLRRPIADRAAWARQLAHLVNVQQRHDVSVRVLAADVGPHEATIAGPFVILDFPGRGARAPEPTTIYCESLTGALYLDQPDELQAYFDTWNAVSARALDRAASDDLIGEIIKEYT
jgi:transcriptional regulator with XRE-family HTH domain